MNQRWGLDRNHVLRHMDIPRESNNTTKIPVQNENDVTRYLWLFFLYINIKIGKNSC